MKNIVHYFLGRLGYRLIPSSVDPVGSSLVNVSSEEIKLLMNDIKNFKSNIDSKNNFWARKGNLRGYLSNSRISFFNTLLSVIDENGYDLNYKSIADFGCGTGFLLRLLYRRYAGVKLRGFDPYTELIEVAKNLCPEASYGSVDVYESSGFLFDCIFCTEVLEHLLYPHKAVEQLANQLSPGGSLFLTVPNGREDVSPANRMHEHGKGYIGHINFWSPESWNIFIQLNLVNYKIKTGKIGDKLYAFAESK